MRNFLRHDAMEKYRIEIEVVMKKVVTGWGKDEDDAINRTFRNFDYGYIKFDEDEDVEIATCSILEPVEVKTFNKKSKK